MESVQAATGPPVLIVAPDERWLRILEITVRLGGYVPVARRSTDDALRVRAGERRPVAIVFDLGDRWTPADLEAVRGLLLSSSVPAVVILPKRLAEERDRVVEAGATVVIRPYAPSELHAALPPVGTPAPDTPPVGTASSGTPSPGPVPAAAEVRATPTDDPH